MADTISMGFTIWFTGLPCSGKTTIAGIVGKYLQDRGCKVELLDGEKVRGRLYKDLGFGKVDRDTHIRNLGFISHLLSRNGIVAIVSAVSPYREARDANRELIGSFVEVYVKCPLQMCTKRDEKGLYEKALQGAIKHFTGISDPYEEPLAPEIVIETDKEGAQECAARIINRLEELGCIPEGVEGGESPQEEEIYSVEEEEKIKKRLEDLGYI